MRFLLVEEFDNEVYRDLEEQLIEDFYALSEIDLMKYFDESIETGGGAVWVTPNGKVIKLDMHQDLGGELFTNFCREFFNNHPEYEGDYDEDDFALDDALEHNDHLVYNLGWVKFNSGTLYDDRYYVVLPKRMTDKQFRVFESLLEDTYDSNGKLLVLPQTISPIIYYFSKHSPADVIKCLKRFFSIGILEESKLYEASIDPEGKYTDYGTGKVTDDDIFDDRTHISFFDQLFTNPEYMAKKENMKGHIEMMSPREYFDMCHKDISE